MTTVDCKTKRAARIAGRIARNIAVILAATTIFGFKAAETQAAVAAPQAALALAAR